MWSIGRRAVAGVEPLVVSFGRREVPWRAMTEPTTLPATSDRSFFGHPRGLATLFFTEMWERFSFYGMRALLILYMTADAARGGLALAVPTAGAVYALYTSLVYLMGLPGGWIADRFMGLLSGTPAPLDALRHGLVPGIQVPGTAGTADPSSAPLP
jgi:hypothetical protein